MKALIDTNVILDVLAKRENFFKPAEKIFKLCEIKKLEGYISALSVPNIVYIMRKQLDNDKISDILNTLFMIFNVADLKSADLIKAEQLRFNDYEDALQSVCASRIKADYIITRNIKDFTDSKVKPISPDDFLKTI